jgi:hypothetical protein
MGLFDANVSTLVKLRYELEKVRVRAFVRSRRRGRQATILAATLITASAPGLAGAAPAVADTAPAAGVPATVSADPLPTWQMNGVVWSEVTVGNTVYATGDFSRARPPGTPMGSKKGVVRWNLLAFNITTGNLITSFNHALNAQGLRIVASPNGKRIYVGGDFTAVDGKTRDHIAAFDTATGKLDTAFHPAVSSVVRGIAATNSKVYFGGNFFSVNGHARTRLAAAQASNGALLSWAPTADDDEVFALLMSPDQSRVIIGGRFQKLNGARHIGIGAVDPVTGGSVRWDSTPIPARLGQFMDFSYVTDLVTDGKTVYGAADGEGGHWFDGRFAASPDTGALVWLDNCYGATYGIYPTGKVLYSVSHAHDCSSLGTFPQTVPTTWHRGLAETTYKTGTDKSAPGSQSSYAHQPIPTQLHWYPTIQFGTFTGQDQGAWSITGNGKYIALGGEFPTVNGRAQQGLVRFAVKASAPNKVGPVSSTSLRPSAIRITGGTVRVSWKTTWDEDNANLTYKVLRDGKVIATVHRVSQFWSLPSLSFTDKGLKAGSKHTYRIQVTDPLGNSTSSAVTPAIKA